MMWRRKKRGVEEVDMRVNAPTTLREKEKVVSVARDLPSDDCGEIKTPEQLSSSMDEVAVEAYKEGLVAFEIDFGDDEISMAKGRYHISDDLWGEVNRLSCEQQAQIIYRMVYAVHIWSALQAVKQRPAPLGSLRGREHLGLPLEMAGEDNVVRILDRLTKILPSLGLDKGVTMGEGNGVMYPLVMTFFYKTRVQFWKRYGIDASFATMCRFIMRIRTKIPNWPPELAKVYEDYEVALDACDRISMNYACPKLHARRR